ncbi:TOMM precursor leader peptide-binding protein [Kallotenue papyrolyticum]|uniref:TOMM precursor leader peptide-binding protein n=1 Tax=Kallotenue papyrolyticum TaxID=1325125 RepID=UPI000492A770|nr:TOMM precursor leader peptide-binding protein [Kallotenue papyrolyticum]
MSRSQTRRLLLLTAGPLGARVRDLLERSALPMIAYDLAEWGGWSEDDFAAALEQAEAQLAAGVLWRPFPTLMQQFNAAAYRRGIPWTIGLLDTTVIQIGPTVIPGETACYTCFLKRFLTNSGLSRIDMETLAFYDHDQQAGHRGQLAPLEQFAARLISMELQRLSSGETVASTGAYWYMDPIRHDQGRHPIVPVPWCRICSRVEDPQEWSYKHLAEALAERMVLKRKIHV